MKSLVALRDTELFLDIVIVK